jgi:pyrroline-5-carboxylate reductase
MRIGFIGAGNMGGAIIKGYAVAQAADSSKRYPDALIVYDADPEKAEAFAHMPGVSAAQSLAQAVGLSDVVVLCVKPNTIESILEDLVEIPVENKLFVSIAAGISIGFLQSRLGAGAKVVRVMPNTPAMVGAGMSALSAGEGLTDAERFAAESLFSAVGVAVWVPEDRMDIVTGVSGSSPAYAYMYIEGLVNAGMAGGLSKEAATILAAQSTLGAAKMVLANIGDPETGTGGTDPVRLRVNVCSPGGTTIEAVRILEEDGFIAAVERAARAAADKSKQMAK